MKFILSYSWKCSDASRSKRGEHLVLTSDVAKP